MEWYALLSLLFLLLVAVHLFVRALLPLPFLCLLPAHRARQLLPPLLHEPQLWLALGLEKSQRCFRLVL